MKLEGRVAVVTGAAGGIGSAIAVEMAREGADVAVSDLDAERCAALVEDITSLGRRAVATSTDVSKRTDMEQLIARAVSEFGRVDIMVNNAGIELVKSIMDTSEEEWDRVLAVNVKGVLFGMQIAGRRMIAQGHGGRIINLASLAGRVGRPLLGAYGTSKAAVLHMTQSAAGTLGVHQITVNALCPGVIETRMGLAVRDQIQELADTGKARREIVAAAPAVLHDLGQPIDVAKMAVFLATDDAGYITGQAINICGGRRMN